MPWGCIGSSLLGSEGPGTTSCSLPGTFIAVANLKPDIAAGAYNSKPRTPEAST